jgi:hypothetical protein
MVIDEMADIPHVHGGDEVHQADVQRSVHEYVV